MRRTRSSTTNPYRSGFELKLATQLESDGVDFTYEEYSYEYDDKAPPGYVCVDCAGTTLYKSRTYTPDFLLTKTNITIEAKGKFTAKERKKMLQVRSDHPDLDLRLVFMRDNKLSKMSKTKYSEWAQKNDFIYGVGSIPKEWYT